MDEREYKIALSLADGVGPVNYRKILDHIGSAGASVEELLTGDEKLLAGLHLPTKMAGSIRSLGENLDQVQELLDQLADQEIRVVTEEDEDYPRRLSVTLGKNAPPVLYCYGNVGLFQEPSGAVVGSRSPEETTLGLARQAAAALVHAGRTVVSGGARGVDSAAHREALESGGSTIGVLSQGILAVKPSELVTEETDGSRCLLVSEFPPKLTWNAGAAMARNKTVCALSDLVIVIQAGEKGGTRHASAAAVKMGRPVFVISPPQPAMPGWEGNKALIREGATSLEVCEQTGEANFSPILQAPSLPEQNNAGERPDAREQQMLF